ncbi:T9SS type A sorting domain-containing protein [Flavobacterium sp. F-65]|uniref:T9SS type A sorting domain-containing protein n=1 Tax=Flavobacterium pisciphilum TaxID=2893755 RepID=A0ABS8N051_9FLAO|nr:T9SS type A sorting domain-containing protein [Flavobacterium sp. F-65]MCC9074404.1 T9SS type A sorting domain-containing protein [Flavobacterium sp. F-65]
MRKLLLSLLLLPSLFQAQNAASADPGFIPATVWNNYEKQVNDMALQSDGKIVIEATQYDYDTGWTRTIERLNADGSSDAAFKVLTDNTANSHECQIVIQSDGKIILGSQFTVAGVIKPMIRLNTDGTIDTTFDTPALPTSSYIYCLTLLPDGKLLVGNDSSKKLLRLTADGALDTTFYDEHPEIQSCRAVLVLPDGKLIVAGSMLDPGGAVTYYNIEKLNANGTIDPAFDISTSFIGRNGYTSSLALQPDGKILVGGRFDTCDGNNSKSLARLHPDGSYDNTFTSPIYDTEPVVNDILVRPNGNILIGGNFSASSIYGIAMLLPNGSVTYSFSPSMAGTSVTITEYSEVRRVLQQPNGMILHCGDYGNIGGQLYKTNMIRLLGTDSYLVNGYTRLDMQNNGCTDVDPGFPYLKYKLVNGTTQSSYYSTSNGYHGVMLKNGTSVITPILDNPTWFSVSPSSISLNMPSATNYANQNFCVTAVGSHHDLSVSIVPINRATPGFDAYYEVLVRNNGNQTATGTVGFTYDAATAEYIQSTPLAAGAGFGSVTWNIEGLLPLSEVKYIVKLNLNTPTDTPPLNANDVLKFSAVANIAQDEVATNDEATLEQTVVNSFDPNDKICLGGDYVRPEHVGDYMYYRIRFENLGTASAQNIKVTDMIDTTKFDIASLSPVDGSHPFTTRVIQGNQVEFMFNNIQLGFADENNDGYLVFKIRSLNSLTEGAVLENTASIYFDYNLPVVTNTSVVTVQTSLHTISFETIKLALYPVPAGDMVFISIPKQVNVQSVTVYNLLGQSVLENVRPGPQGDVNVTTLATGSYLMRVRTELGDGVMRFVKK